MERISLTEAELIQELQTALQHASEGDDGLSVADLQEATGRSSNTVRAAIRKLMGTGKVEVGQRPGYRIDGRKCFTPVYRVRP